MGRGGVEKWLALQLFTLVSFDLLPLRTAE